MKQKRGGKLAKERKQKETEIKVDSKEYNKRLQERKKNEKEIYKLPSDASKIILSLYQHKTCNFNIDQRNDISK